MTDPQIVALLILCFFYGLAVLAYAADAITGDLTIIFAFGLTMWYIGVLLI